MSNWWGFYFLGGPGFSVKFLFRSPRGRGKWTREAELSASSPAFPSFPFSHFKGHKES